MLLPLAYSSPVFNSWLKSQPGTQPACYGHRRLKQLAVNANGKDGKAKSVSFGDKLLDYIEGGPKLRKWYGASDDQTQLDESQDELDTTEEEVRDATLVTDADSITGQLIVLSLIVQRTRVRILVSDEKLATAAFGSYVEPVVGHVDDEKSLIKACRGVRAIICPTKLGAFLTDKKLLKGVEDFVYLSEVASLRAEKGLKVLLRGPGAVEQALQEESALSTLGIRYTIIRHATLKDEPGGQLGIDIRIVDANGSSLSSQSQRPTLGTISREDVATLCVKVLNATLNESVIFEAFNVDGEVQNLETVFATFIKT